MRTAGKIVGYSVNRKHISIKIETAGTTTVIDELEQYKGRTKTIRLDTFQTVGTIESITISKNVVFLVHAARLDFIGRRLFGLMEKDPLNIEVSTTEQDKLLYFLDTVARKRNQRAGDLLFELSCFRKKDGNRERTIPGKKSVFELSEPRLKVVFDKISHLAATQ